MDLRKLAYNETRNKDSVVFQVREGGTWNRVATVDMEKMVLVLVEMKPVGIGNSGENALLVQCC